MKIRFPALICALLACCSATTATEAYRVQLLQEARNLFHSATNRSMYAEAAEQYEYLIRDEQIRNGRIFYTAGNCWFMAGEPGKALLNYRRAEQYMPGDADLQHNLESAKALQLDRMEVMDHKNRKEPWVGWLTKFSPRWRWRAFCALWIALWCSWLIWRRSSIPIARSVFFTLSIPTALVMLSLAADMVENLRNEPGVITADEVLARKGNGEMYSPAFTDPLHSGTEFNLIEARGNWWHVELIDGQHCWIPAEAAETVDLLSE